ncbi:uncharacterized protein LOC132921576 isoform X2 [Rhopalosiphum padi]|uniref:uncharacterized protein LOC132920918 isoform X2 n=1 Tax=Rhopalosiphum padi TaxID=40932 RepID=UPI00298E1AE9|nr:uncharacterized protein LOC132920918 isoform X2 [Rhopalosiphum padi]XP_060840647.1 uncharacterized protein LOC132921576 isoform X2 [Rhopalosiphum padi]
MEGKTVRHGEMNNFLWHVAPKGLLKVKTNSALERYYFKMQKTKLRMIAEKLDIIARREEIKLMRWLVKGKIETWDISDSLENTPVIRNRLEVERLLELNKKPYKKPYQHPCTKRLERQNFKNLTPEVERWGIIFREVKFGESFNVDHYHHGRLLKRKIKEHKIETGLYMRRSNFQLKLKDENADAMKKIPLHDFKTLFETSNKLMKEPVCWHY